MARTRGQRAIRWIETYCLVPHGLDKGRRVKLTAEQRAACRWIYDHTNGPRWEPVGAPLAGYLALLHLCGPEALQRNFQPEVDADIFTVWNATSPDLRAVLKRVGARVVCPELNTSYPRAA
jgi:hypothetical protein